MPDVFESDLCGNSSVVASLSTLERLLSSGEKDVEQWHSVVTKIHHLISIQGPSRRHRTSNEIVNCCYGDLRLNLMLQTHVGVTFWRKNTVALNCC